MPLILRPKAFCRIAARRPSGVASAARRLPASCSSPRALATRRTLSTSSHARGRLPLRPRKMAARTWPASLTSMRAAGGDQAGVRQGIDLAVDQRAPTGRGQPVHDEGSKIARHVGCGEAAPGAGNAHQDDRAQAIGVERAGRHRLLQQSGLHGHWASPHRNERSCAAPRGTQRAMSQRPPDARITGGFTAILLKSV